MSGRVEIDVIFEAEVPYSVLVLDEDGREVWLPMKEICDYREGYWDRGDCMVVDIPIWLAEKRGLV